ncbi:MAG TPA: transglutaminase family protein [Mycobacteriales bacterium]
MRRIVSASLSISVTEPAQIDLQIAVADRALVKSESLLVSTAGRSIDPVELEIAGSGRIHRFTAPPGELEVRYLAAVDGRSGGQPATSADEVVFVRPSRYAESDRLFAVAQAEFQGVDDPRDLLEAVSSWVGGHLSYIPGSSRPTDGAVSTMLQRSGVCRDYAHLVVALLRARSVPARVAAVYAPGLDPMDFHAVAEAAIDGHWYAADATLLAPRSSLLRISTGRDAADTAFLSAYNGVLELRDIEVTATTEGSLPTDDVRELVELG